MGLNKYQPPKRKSTLTKKQKDQVAKTLVILREVWDKSYKKGEYLRTMDGYSFGRILMYGGDLSVRSKEES